MDINHFHKTFYDHLMEKSEDVSQIVALDSNLEKWFQGEMVLAFSGSEFRVFSSEFYNEEADDIDDTDWDAYLAKRGIITIEGNIYKAVKTGKRQSTGARKVDFIMESSEEFIFSEIKILWLCDKLSALNETDAPDDFQDALNKYLEKKKVFDDAWRMKKNPYSEFRGHRKKARKYLSLICIFDRQLGNNFKILKERMANTINGYFEDRSVISSFNSQIQIDMVDNFPTDYYRLSAKKPDRKSKKHYVYLMTIDLK